MSSIRKFFNPRQDLHDCRNKLSTSIWCLDNTWTFRMVKQKAMKGRNSIESYEIPFDCRIFYIFYFSISVVVTHPFSYKNKRSLKFDWNWIKKKIFSTSISSSSPSQSRLMKNYFQLNGLKKEWHKGEKWEKDFLEHVTGRRSIDLLLRECGKNLELNWKLPCNRPENSESFTI